MHIEYISASRLNTYITCPFKYFLEYHIRHPDTNKDTIYSTKGSAIHDALELYVKENKPFEDSLKKYYAETKLWYLDNRSQFKGYPHPVEKNCSECKWASKNGEKTFCTIANRLTDDFEGCPKPHFEEDLKLLYYVLNRKGEEDNIFERKIIGAEVPFDMEFDGFRVHGYIDLITEIDEQTIEVRDYKTSNRAKTIEEAFKDFQMRIYSLVAKKLYPQYKYVLMSLDYLKKYSVPVIFSEDDDKETERFLRKAYKAIKECDNPRRIKSYMCNWCVGYDKCGEIKNKYRNHDGQFILPKPVKGGDYGRKKKKNSGKKLPTVGENNDTDGSSTHAL